MVVRIHLCGRITVVGGGGAIDERDLPGRQGRLALARLCLEQGRPVSTERLIDGLWGDEPPQDASGALASIVSKLRINLKRADPDEPAVILAGPGTYELRLRTGSTVDLQDARNAIDRAEGDRRRLDARAAWANATVAVSIARRGFLPSEHAGWVRAVGGELERTALRGYDCLTWVWTTRGDGVLATAMAQQAVDLAPLHEPAWRALMTAQAEFGSRADALRTYRRCCDTLSGELGVSPDPATVRLYEHLLAQ
jgi:SARP family transcriptional regulator, regulator of embCAB operon